MIVEYLKIYKPDQESQVKPKCKTDIIKRIITLSIAKSMHFNVNSGNGYLNVYLYNDNTEGDFRYKMDYGRVLHNEIAKILPIFNSAIMVNLGVITISFLLYE